MSEYSKFGPVDVLTEDEVDPVWKCVGNTFFSKQGTPSAYMEKDACPTFMSQRCAAKWDSFCDVYLTDTKMDMGGYKRTDTKWLEEVARKKYCRINTDAPGARCAKRCQSLNAPGQTSVEICDTIGVQNWLNDDAEIGIGGNFPQSSRLNNLSPIYMNKCPDICDAKNTMSDDALGPNDIVLNKCIELGACSDVLMDLAYNTVAQNIPVTNPAFKKLVELAKIDRPINPNVAARISREYGIPQEATIDLLRLAQQNSGGGLSEGNGNLNDIGDIFQSGEKGGKGKEYFKNAVVFPMKNVVVSPVTDDYPKKKNKEENREENREKSNKKDNKKDNKREKGRKNVRFNITANNNNGNNRGDEKEGMGKYLYLIAILTIILLFVLFFPRLGK